MENEIKPISQIQDELLENTVSKNREMLSSIIKTILLCGRHNIPLRGHRDDSNNYASKHCGNFQALLDFRVDSSDEVLKQHFQSAPRNATYRSKRIQNELISFFAEALNTQEEIRDAKFYSILADEVKDCSNREQMPVIIRFVDKCGEIQERFIKFIHCDTGLTGYTIH